MLLASAGTCVRACVRRPGFNFLAALRATLTNYTYVRVCMCFQSWTKAKQTIRAINDLGKQARVDASRTTNTRRGKYIAPGHSVRNGIMHEQRTDLDGFVARYLSRLSEIQFPRESRICAGINPRNSALFFITRIIKRSWMLSTCALYSSRIKFARITAVFYSCVRK